VHSSPRRLNLKEWRAKYIPVLRKFEAIWEAEAEVEADEFLD